MPIEVITEDELLDYKRVHGLLSGTGGGPVGIEWTDELIIEVPSYYSLPAWAQESIDHIHQTFRDESVCMKNRFNRKCS